MADGRVKIIIEVDGKEVNVASDELKKLGKSGWESGKGISEAEKGMGKAGVSAKQLAISLGLVKIASAAFNVLKKSLDSAISRFDTLNTFPKIMNSVGVSSHEAEAAINKLANGLEGTTGYLDQVTSNAQRMFFALGDLDKSADLALALQRAFDASAASTDQAKRGTEQFIQALQKGKFDMEEWKTLQETMGVGLNELAKEFGFTGASAQRDLYQALQDGHIPMDEFTDKLIEIGSATGVLGEMAKTNASTLRNEMEFLANAATKGLANILESVNNLVQEVTGKDLAGHIQGLRFIVDASFNAMGAAIEGFGSVIKVAIPIVSALTPAIVGLMTAYAAYTVITKARDAIQASNAILKVAQASKTGLTLVTKAHTVALAADLKMEQASAAAMIANSGAITLKQIAIGVLTGQMTLLAGAQTIAAAASAKFGAVMAALTGPVGWVVAGIGLLTAGAIAAVKWFNRTSEEGEKLAKETDTLAQSTENLTDSIDNTSETYKQNQREIKSTAEANRDLIGRIEELSEKENKSAEDKLLLNGYINRLNESVDGLNLSYNEESGALSESSEKLRERIGLIEEETSFNDALERQNEITQELIEIDLQRKETNELIAEANVLRDEGSITNKDYKDTIEKLEEQEELLIETEGRLKEENAELTEQIEVSAKAQAEAVNESTESMMIDFANLEGAQKEAFDNMTTTYEELVDSATNAFDKLDTETEHTMDSMIETLEHNQEVVERWGENQASLMEWAGKNGYDNLIPYIENMGIDSAAELEIMANATDEEMTAFAEALGSGAEIGGESFKTSLGNEFDEAIDQMIDFVDDSSSTMRQRMESAGFDKIGEAIPEGVVGGVEKGTPNVEKATGDMADSATDAAKSALGVQSPSTVFKTIGTNITEGLVLGINAGKSKVVQAIQRMFRQVETSSTQSFNNITRSYDSAINQIDRSLSRLPNITQKSMTNMSSTIKAASAAQISALKTLTQNYDREVDNIGRSLNELPGKAQKSMQNMNSRLKSGSNTNAQVMTKLSRDLISPFNSLNPSFRSIGANAMSGLNSGLNAGRNRVMSTARSIANSVAATMRSSLRIQSPSRVMKDDVGRWIPEGIAEGIEDRASVVYDALNELNTSMVRFSTPEVALGMTGMSANAFTATSGYSTNTNTTVNNHSKPTVHIEKIENYSDSDIPKILEESAWIMEREGSRLHE